MNLQQAELKDPLSDDHVLDIAYDIFLSLAPDNLDSADQLLFNLQFEECGAAELYSPDTTFWSSILTEDKCLDNDHFVEVIIGLTNKGGNIVDIFARLTPEPGYIHPSL